MLPFGLVVLMVMLSIAVVGQESAAPRTPVRHPKKSEKFEAIIDQCYLTW